VLIEHNLVNGFNDDYDYIDIVFPIDPQYRDIYLLPTLQKYKNSSC